MNRVRFAKRKWFCLFGLASKLGLFRNPWFGRLGKRLPPGGSFFFGPGLLLQEQRPVEHQGQRRGLPLGPDGDQKTLAIRGDLVHPATRPRTTGMPSDRTVPTSTAYRCRRFLTIVARAGGVPVAQTIEWALKRTEDALPKDAGRPREAIASDN